MPRRRLVGEATVRGTAGPSPQGARDIRDVTSPRRSMRPPGLAGPPQDCV